VPGDDALNAPLIFLALQGNQLVDFEIHDFSDPTPIRLASMI